MLASPLHLEAQETWEISEGEVVESLLGLALPSVRLACATGGEMDLATLTVEPVVVYLYPGTETSREVPEDPDGLLGSGCTLQGRLFSEYLPCFTGRRFQVVGISSSPAEEQRLFAQRERLRFPLLSDLAMEVADAINLPTSLGPTGQRVYNRLTFIAHQGAIDRVFYPIPIPRRNAIDVLAWVDRVGIVL